MKEEAGFLDRPDGERLAWRRIAGGGPTFVWLGGFRSDMAGTKAEALAEWAAASGHAYVRFDYFGHGESTGAFERGTITRWREDALAVLDALTDGPLVLVGSSMGGWISCLAAAVRAERIAGLILIAPAADFTSALMAPEMTVADRQALEETGIWLRPSDYGAPYPISRDLLEDGARWTILPGPVPVTAPVRVLQGGADPDVPWSHALALAQALETEDLVFSLIKDGDHRLSRPQDLGRLIAAAEELTRNWDRPGC